MTTPTTELDRLGQYNAGVYDSGTNPYGMDGYGYVSNLPLLASDAATVAVWLADQAAIVGDLEDDIETLAGIQSQITTLAAQSANITTLAGLSSALTTLAGLSSALTTLAGIASSISTVAGISSAVSAVGPIAAAVSTVAGIAANITAVAGNATNINTVAGLNTAITALGSISANITTVAGIAANVTTVAGINAQITALAAVATAISTVASNISNVNIVAGVSGNVTTVAGIATAISALGSITSAISTLAGIAGDVSTTAAASAAITTCANNIAAITGAATQASNAAASASAAAASAAAAKRTALFQTFDTATADADPGNGKVRFNNSTLSSVTAIFMDLLDINGGDLSGWIDTFDDSTNTAFRGVLTFVSVANSANWAKFKVTGGNTSASGYRKIAVAFLASNGSFSAGDVSIDFAPAGNKGSDGAGSGDVVGPGGATDSAIALFDTTTGKLLKDSGVALSALATSSQGAKADTALQPAAVGVSVQAYHANLAAFAALTLIADRLSYADGSGTLALATFTAAARTLLAASSASAQRTALGLAIGADVQAYSANLAALAGLVSAADKLAYFTGSGTASLTSLTSFVRSLLDDADAATFMTTLGFSANAQSLVTAANYAAMRTALSLVPGTDVQAYDADLAAIAALSSAANKGLYATGAGTWALYDLTSFGRSLDGSADAAAAKTLLALAKADVALGNVDNTSDATKNAATATLTNKRITKRVHTQASTATLTPDIDSYDAEEITAQAASLSVAAPTGTPTDGQPIIIRLKDNGTARAISWNAAFRALGVTLPTSTVISKTVYVGCLYNAADSKYDAVAVGQEA